MVGWINGLMDVTVAMHCDGTKMVGMGGLMVGWINGWLEWLEWLDVGSDGPRLVSGPTRMVGWINGLLDVSVAMHCDATKMVGMVGLMVG